MGEVAHEVDVLKVQRLVKPIVPFGGRPNLRIPGRALAKDCLDWIAWHCLNKDECRNTYQEQHEERLNEPAAYVRPNAHSHLPRASCSNESNVDEPLTAGCQLAVRRRGDYAPVSSLVAYRN